MLHRGERLARNIGAVSRLCCLDDIKRTVLLLGNILEIQTVKGSNPKQVYLEVRPILFHKTHREVFVGLQL